MKKFYKGSEYSDTDTYRFFHKEYSIHHTKEMSKGTHTFFNHFDIAKPKEEIWSELKYESPNNIEFKIATLFLWIAQ